MYKVHALIKNGICAVALKVAIVPTFYAKVSNVLRNNPNVLHQGL